MALIGARSRMDVLPRIVYPKLSDPRLVQIGMLGTFTLLGKLILGFTVSWLQIVTAILAVCLLDLALTYWRAGILLVPASGLISGLSLGLLLRSPHWWPFLVAGAFTALGKQGIQLGGRHVFNPSNFGLVVTLALPWAQARLTPGQWGKSWVLLFLLLNLGFFIAYKVRRFHLVAAFVGSVAVFGLIRSLLGTTSLATLSVTLLSGSFILFTFFMITDPQTSPGTVRGRLCYGVAVAAVDALLRVMGVPYSLFLALLIVCAIYTAGRVLAGIGPSQTLWQTATTGGKVPR